MEVTFFLTADYASLSDGKLNILGIFSHIRAAEFPALHPHVYLVANLVGKAAEYGRRFNVDMKLIDENGHEVHKLLEGSATFPTALDGHPTTFGLIVPVINLLIPRAGAYKFVLWIDNDAKASTTMDVIQIPRS